MPTQRASTTESVYMCCVKYSLIYLIEIHWPLFLLFSLVICQITLTTMSVRWFYIFPHYCQLNLITRRQRWQYPVERMNLPCPMNNLAYTWQINHQAGPWSLWYSATTNCSYYLSDVFTAILSLSDYSVIFDVTGPILSKKTHSVKNQWGKNVGYLS